MIAGRFPSTRDRLTRKVTPGETNARTDTVAPQIASPAASPAASLAVPQSVAPSAPAQSQPTSQPTSTPASAPSREPKRYRSRLEGNLDRLYGRTSESQSRAQSQSQSQSWAQSQSRAPSPTPPGRSDLNARKGKGTRTPAPPGAFNPTPGHEAAAPAGTFGEDIDETLKALMRDPRYSDPNQAEDIFRDGISALWKAAYPGFYTPGSWGRNVDPTINMLTLQAMAAPLLSPAPDRAAEGQKGDGRNGDGSQPAPENGPLHRVAFTAPDQGNPDQSTPDQSTSGADPTPETQKPGIGHNSGLTPQDMAALEDTLSDPTLRAETRREILDRIEALKGSADDKAQLEAILETAIPEQAEEPVQVAYAQALLIPLGLLVAGGAGIALMPDRGGDADNDDGINTGSSAGWTAQDILDGLAGVGDTDAFGNILNEANSEEEETPEDAVAEQPSEPNSDKDEPPEGPETPDLLGPDMFSEREQHEGPPPGFEDYELVFTGAKLLDALRQVEDPTRYMDIPQDDDATVQIGSGARSVRMRAETFRLTLDILQSDGSDAAELRELLQADSDNMTAEQVNALSKAIADLERIGHPLPSTGSILARERAAYRFLNDLADTRDTVPPLPEGEGAGRLEHFFGSDTNRSFPIRLGINDALIPPYRPQNGPGSDAVISPGVRLRGKKRELPVGDPILATETRTKRDFDEAFREYITLGDGADYVRQRELDPNFRLNSHEESFIGRFFERVRPNPIKGRSNPIFSNGLRNAEERLYSWDDQKGEFEVFQRYSGGFVHIGTIDPIDGRWIGGPHSEHDRGKQAELGIDDGVEFS